MPRKQPLPPSTSENSIVTAIRQRKKALDAKELAEYIPLSKFTIYKMAQENKIPHMRLGAKIVFDPQQIANWLQERCA